MTERRWWTIIGILVLGIMLWLLKGILFPFLAGMALAYFLDPLADRLERQGIKRVWATVIISLGLLSVLVVVIAFAVPLLYQQAVAFAQAAPGYLDQLQNLLITRFPEVYSEGSQINTAIDNFISMVQERAGEIAGSVLKSSLRLVDAVVAIVVIPVVTFYMLLDWDRMMAKVNRWLPADHAERIRGIAQEIDNVLAGFVRGQLTVCLILGTFYAVALAIVGLDFGLLVGMFAGLLTFIPYVGSIVGGALSIGLALFQFWGDWVMVIAVAAIFVTGQMVEGNFLSPKLVGDSVGLHPVWLMFALSAFATLFGFTGMLIAVPVAACLGVFFRHAMDEYFKSDLYRGTETSSINGDEL
ncbi:AI-2E family transporter [Paracoccaceae bacterium GXU_MW_L88]